MVCELHADPGGGAGLCGGTGRAGLTGARGNNTL